MNRDRPHLAHPDDGARLSLVALGQAAPQLQHLLDEVLNSFKNLTKSGREKFILTARTINKTYIVNTVKSKYN